MDREALSATVQGVTESDMTEHECMPQNMMMAKYNMSVGHKPVARHQFSNAAKRESEADGSF